MSEKVFEPMDPINFGWNTLKNNLRFFIILMAIIGVSRYLLDFISTSVFSNAAPPQKLGYVILFFSILVIPLINLLFEAGLLKIALHFHDGKVPQIQDLFNGYPLLLKYVVATILYGLMVIIGLIFLVVPGIYLALKYQFYGYVIVDKGIGPIGALKESGRLTQGAKKDLFMFWLILLCGMLIIFLLIWFYVAAPISILMALTSWDLLSVLGMATGFFSAIIELLAFTPITNLAMAGIYRILEARSITSAPALQMSGMCV